jgi:hypothetical protein
MLETQPLHGIGQFDIDAEIVGIQLELVAFEQPAILIDIHRERRDVAIDGDFPMLIARRIGLEIDVFRTACENAIFACHWATLTLLFGLPEYAQ